MHLREDQLQRYARQILLKEVGGKGQVRLSSTRIRVVGSAPALELAGVYLSASGCSVDAAPASPSSFLIGQPWSALNPDRLPSESPTLLLTDSEPPAPVSGPVVLLSASQVSFRRDAVCPGCWESLRETDSAPAPEAILGSVAALVAQRLILELEHAFGAIRWAEGGLISVPPHCERHLSHMVRQP